MNDEVKKYYQEGSIMSKVVNIMLDDNIEPIKKMLLQEINPAYDLFTQKEKEGLVFYTIYSEYLLDEKKENFLRYIIFDYNIRKENSIEPIPDLNDKVKAMFELRELNKNLQSELNIQENISKKVKI